MKHLVISGKAELNEDLINDDEVFLQIKENSEVKYLGKNKRKRKFILEENSKLIFVQEMHSISGHRNSKVISRVSENSNSDNEFILNGQKAELKVLEIVKADSDKKFELNNFVEHKAPQTKSRIYSRGIAAGLSKIYCYGKVKINKNTQDCDTFLSQRFLILSKKAKAETFPNLEIETNNVKQAKHEASVCPIDQEQIFYLMSRGLTLEQSKEEIINGFLNAYAK